MGVLLTMLFLKCPQISVRLDSLPFIHYKEPLGRPRRAKKGVSMKRILTFETREREDLVDITEEVRAIVSEYGVGCDLCALYALGATAAIMIQENWDPNIKKDVLDCLRIIVPKGQWIHDRIDGNGDAHIKAGIIGPSEVIPVQEGKLLLSTWQNVFFCEFDGPRSSRKVVVTLI